MREHTNVGIIGTGNISDIYLKNAPGFGLNVVAVADLDLARAQGQAEKYGVEIATSPEELLALSDVEIVLNLTVPGAHAAVARSALSVGKHVYGEKPLATELEAGRDVLALASERGLRVGSAPDTFLGAGLQTARKALDDGLIGEPVAATAFMLGRGPEGWHPNPDFFYQPGAGPLFDMGPYYLTALANMLGPVARVSASARASFSERIGMGGRRIPVGTPTHVAALLDYEAGPVATLITSFDVWHAEVPRIEIYGSEGTLSLPDPNTFGGPVKVRKGEAEEWEELPLAFPHAANSRGIGLAEMASAIRANRPQRASGALGLHVLEIMHACLRASDERRQIDIQSRPPRPAALPQGEEVFA